MEIFFGRNKFINARLPIINEGYSADIIPIYFVTFCNLPEGYIKDKA